MSPVIIFIPLIVLALCLAFHSLSASATEKINYELSAEYQYLKSIGAFDLIVFDGNSIDPRAMTPEWFNRHVASIECGLKNGTT